MLGRAGNDNLIEILPMTLERSDLVELCDQFLDGKIDKSKIEKFAWDAITSDEIDWNGDEIISSTLFQWDNEEIEFPINRVNISLWKNRLLTGEDNLLAFNNWSSHIHAQKEVCSKYSSPWKPINKTLRVGISDNLSGDPINGLRHPSEQGATGWFIWAGEYSDNEDFFKPMCAEHLLQIRPEIIKYLGLDVGFRFLADKAGFEDVWFDETLKSV